jgi:hypothetical protein
MLLPNNTDDTGTVFRDVIFLLMITFVILFLVAAMHINPITEPAEDTITPPGNVIVNIFWEDNVNIDVDLWVQGPDDKRPVGYSNRAGGTFNLLRDDLGNINDITERNFENAYTRGLPAGEYIINVHMFSHKEKVKDWPVMIEVVVTVMEGEDKGSANDVAVATIPLTKDGEEITAVRFKIDKDRKVIEESINQVQKKLRGSSPSSWDF